MPITSRPYRSGADLLRMRDLIVAAVAEGPHTSYFQVGDLIWGLYQNTVFDPFQHIRVWEDADGLLGFVWFQPPDFVVLQLHPRRRSDESLEAQMLAWGEEHRRESLETEQAERLVRSHAYEDDAPRLALFARRDFVRDDEHLVHLERDLDQPIPGLSLPEGFTVRHVGGEQEWPGRVETHREVWHPSKVTLEAYRRLRAVLGYIAELDLVAVAPDGTFASYCICWLDPANRTGEFEPVGTRAAFRGRRLGSAVMLEGLRRLRAYGARTAIVYTAGDNQAALRLYQSVGFRSVKREYYYRKLI